jgi:GNAT superfamily N-acetyltransferase
MALQNDRLAVRHDEAGPNQERSRLAEGDLRVVLAHKAGALRDQKNLPGRAVIDVLGDLGCDPAGEIRTQPGQQRGGDHRTGLENIGTGKGLNTIRAHRLPIDVAVQEAQLVVLQADTRRSRGVRLGAREVCRSILSEVSAPTHVLGYYTLCAMVISRGDVPEAARKHVPRYPLVSATLIGRLAVAKERQGQRLGAVLLADALRRAFDSAGTVGSSMVVVDALDEAAAGFYAAHGFVRLPDSLPLVLPMRMASESTER